MLLPLYYALCERGHDCSFLPLASQVNSSITDLCIGVFLHIDNLPSNFIIWNFEPLSPSSPHLTHRLVNKIRRARLLLHYNPNEIEYVKQFNPNTLYFPFSYHKSLENMYKIELPISEDIDVLFYGTPNTYRNETIEKLREDGINVLSYNQIFQKVRDEMIYRAKIVLLINYYDNNPDMVRVTYLLSQKKCIVVDSFGNNEMKKIYKSFPIVHNNELAHTLRQLLLDKDKRMEIANSSYNEMIQHYQLKSYVSKLVTHF